MSSVSLALLIIQLLQLCLGTHALPTEQQVLQGTKPKSILNVRHELKRAEIIPTVIDDFLPSLTLKVSWPSHKKAELGNTVKPDDVQEIPSLELHDEPTSSASSAVSNMTYTVALTDPDAPSRDNPEWSEMCHWIATGVPLSSESTANAADMEAATQTAAKGLKEIMEYKPPGPPPKTGKHRYVFLAFAPANGTSRELHLSKPKDRQHWGYDGERMGVRKWAEENGLVPIAANFIYSQNAKQ